jgi:hypothetical protein
MRMKGHAKRDRARWRNMTPGLHDEPRFSHGAASEVRHIDPSTYQPPIIHSHVERPQAQNKTVALLDQADAILLKDAKRRGGKRFAKRTRNLIVTGRYGGVR